MRLPDLLAVALALLGFGAFMIGVDALSSWIGPRDAALMSGHRRIQTRDELGRPVCRRRFSGDDQYHTVEIGHRCP